MSESGEVGVEDAAEALNGELAALHERAMRITWTATIVTGIAGLAAAAVQVLAGAPWHLLVTTSGPRNLTREKLPN